MFPLSAGLGTSSKTAVASGGLAWRHVSPQPLASTLDAPPTRHERHLHRQGRREVVQSLPNSYVARTIDCSRRIARKGEEKWQLAAGRTVARGRPTSFCLQSLVQRVRTRSASTTTVCTTTCSERSSLSRVRVSPTSHLAACRYASTPAYLHGLTCFLAWGESSSCL